MTWTEQVARPGHRTYRARKGPAVEEFGESLHDDGGYLVLRTHDVDVAVALVADRWAGSHGGPLPAPQVRWLRCVPWDDYSGLDYSWMDVQPGERGAIPVVEFADR